MKYYTITVNGNTYEVSVEENNGVSSVAPTPAPRVAPTPVPQAPVQKAAPAPTPADAPAPKAASGTEGKTRLIHLCRAKYYH